MATSASPQTGIYKDQHAGRSATMHFDEDGHLDLTSGSVALPGALGQGFIDLSPYIFGARQLASAEQFIAGSSAETAFWGGILYGGTATAGTPAMVLNSSVDQAFHLNYASAVVVAIKLPPIFMPGDMSTAGGLTIGLFGESVGTGTASDAAAGFDIRCWAGIGDTEMGATHPNFSSTPSLQTISIASGDLTTDVLNITLVPSAHAGRAIRLYGGRITYTKKTS